MIRYILFIMVLACVGAIVFKYARVFYQKLETKESKLYQKFEDKVDPFDIDQLNIK